VIGRALPALALVALGACATAPPRVELSFPPGGAPLNEYFSLDVAVEGALPERIEVDADMPGHRHGMASTPLVHTLAPGRFRVDGMLFHMPGSWEVYVTLVRGEARALSTFAVEVEP